MSPKTYQVSVAIFKQVAVEYWARSLGALAVAPVEATVVVPDVTA